MTFSGLYQCIILVLCLLLLTRPLGLYLYRVYSGEPTFLDPFLNPIENLFYKCMGIRPHEEQSFKAYTISFLSFNLVGFLFLFALLSLQYYLPLNPAHITNMPFSLAFNTAVSFVTNTNWQAYAGETGVSYFSQSIGLSLQNFLSAAVGMSVAVALVRALARSRADTIGNFWTDLTRSILWVLLPLALILALVYISQGVPQNFHPYVTAHTLQGALQTVPQGPVASQEAIKSLGTNGGGFFNANSAHPYENPTMVTNFLQILSIFSIGVALTYMFGRMVDDQKQGWMILFVMLFLFVGGFLVMFFSELHGSAQIAGLPIQDHFLNKAHVTNMEGKEVRFDIGSSVLYDQVATCASDGGVNSMLDSYTPTGGAVALLNMALGEVIVGGVGSGLYGMLLFVLLSVFIGGLMVGRSPEFLGKRVEGREMKMVMLGLLASPLAVLFLTGLACITKGGLAGPSVAGAHGFTQILYAYVSGAANNGSAFAGLNANSTFYNITVGLAMLIGRYGTIVPVLMIAGSLVQKQRKPVSKGTLPTSGIVFGILLICVILIMAGLTIFPALSLGPIAEAL